MDMTITVSKTQPSLVEFTDYLATVTKEDAIESIKNLAQMESEDWFRIGMILSSYRKSKGDEEFKSLLSYSEENLQINGRKAYYLISIHDSLVASNISPSQVTEVGWTKLKEIAHLLTPENVDYWVDLCKTNTTKQLVALLKSGATTDSEKAASIDDALEETVAPVKTETAFAEPVITGVDVAEEGADSTVTATVVQGHIDNVEFTPTAKYDTDFSEPVGSDEHNAPTHPYPEEPNLEIQEEAPPEETVVVSVEAAPEPSVSVDELVEKLKLYELKTVVAMVTEIYPHIKITVTEKSDAAIAD